MELGIATPNWRTTSTAPIRASVNSPFYTQLVTSSKISFSRFSSSLDSLRCRSPPRILATKATGDTASEGSAPNAPIAADVAGLYKKVLLPVIDRNPYLSEATRQAAATATALAKKYGAEITVAVIDESTKETIADYDLRIKNIRWHLAEGGFEEFGLIESLGEGKLPAAVIGEIADDMNQDLVVLTMESIHSKHIDGNLLPEFVPCPILLLPL